VTHRGPFQPLLFCDSVEIKSVRTFWRASDRLEKLASPRGSLPSTQPKVFKTHQSRIPDEARAGKSCSGLAGLRNRPSWLNLWAGKFRMAPLSLSFTAVLLALDVHSHGVFISPRPRSSQLPGP